MLSEINMTCMLYPNVLVIEYWNLEIICYLVLEICDFIICSKLSMTTAISENSKRMIRIVHEIKIRLLLQLARIGGRGTASR